MPDRVTPTWLLKALTPPIVVIAVKGLLRRLGHLPPKRPEPEPDLPDATEPPEFEVVPTERIATGGWDAGAVAEAYVEKWPQWVAALEGPGPLGVYHEARAGEHLARDDLAAHNMLLSFAYVVARAAAGRDRISVLDWGGGLGHYAVLADAVLPQTTFDWHCREVPSIAAAGAKANPSVTFHADDRCLDRTYDLVFASSSLQYEPDWERLLGRLAAATTGFLFVTRVPVALETESFAVLQRAGAYGYETEYAGWVIARSRLLTAAESAGLVLERELLLDAWMSPAGAAESPIGHRGFLFRPRGKEQLSD